MVARTHLNVRLFVHCLSCLSLVIRKATYTQSEYVLLIAFSLQQWLQDRTSMLGYSCISYLVCLVIRKATSTHSEYVILIAFSLQQWLQEPTSVLGYSCISYLVCLW